MADLKNSQGHTLGFACHLCPSRDLSQKRSWTSFLARLGASQVVSGWSETKHGSKLFTLRLGLYNYEKNRRLGVVTHMACAGQRIERVLTPCHSGNNWPLLPGFQGTQHFSRPFTGIAKWIHDDPCIPMVEWFSRLVVVFPSRKVSHNITRLHGSVAARSSISHLSASQPWSPTGQTHCGVKTKPAKLGRKNRQQSVDISNNKQLFVAFWTGTFFVGPLQPYSWRVFSWLNDFEWQTIQFWHFILTVWAGD